MISERVAAKIAHLEKDLARATRDVEDMEYEKGIAEREYIVACSRLEHAESSENLIATELDLWREAAGEESGNE